MRILRVANIPNNRHGGMSRTMHCTGDEFIKAGHEIEYVFAEDFVSRAPRKLRRFTDAWSAMRLVAARIERSAFDVVEIHEPLAGIYAWEKRRHPEWPPVVAFSYGLEERGREAMLGYRKSKSIPVPRISRVTSWLSAKQGAFAVRHADHVVCSNGTDASHLVASGIPPTRITHHFSGVDEVFLEAAPSAATANRKRLLFVGMWIERKGILDLVDAFRIVSRHHPDIQLTIAGSLADSAAVLQSFPPPLRPSVEVIPRISNDRELVAVYQAHGVFVLPSYFEGQPLSLIEAAAIGVVPVVTDIGGCRDFVIHGDTGLLAPVGDGQALASRIRMLVEEPDLVAKLAENARKHAARHTWRSSAQQLLSAYGALANDNKAGRR